MQPAGGVVSRGARVAERVGLGQDTVEAVVGLGPALTEFVEPGDQVAVGVVLVGRGVAQRIGDADEPVGGVVEVGRRVSERVGDVIHRAARGVNRERLVGAAAVGGVGALIGGIVGVGGPLPLAVRGREQVAAGVIDLVENTAQDVLDADGVAVEVKRVRGGVVQRIDLSEFPADLVDDERSGVGGWVGARDEEAIRVIGESGDVSVGVGRGEHQAVRGIAVADQRTQGIGMGGEVPAGVVSVGVCPSGPAVGVGRLGRDLLDGLVEEGVESPARDFTQGVGAGDDVGAVVVAEEGGPAERFGDGGAVAVFVVGIAGDVGQRVLLRQDVAFAVVGLEPLEAAWVSVPNLAVGGHVVLGAGGAGERVQDVGLAPVLVILDQDVGIPPWVEDALQEAVGGVVGELPGGVAGRVEAGGVGDGFGDKPIGGIVAEVDLPRAKGEIGEEVALGVVEELVHPTRRVHHVIHATPVQVPDDLHAVGVEIPNLDETPGDQAVRVELQVQGRVPEAIDQAFRRDPLEVAVVHQGQFATVLPVLGRPEVVGLEPSLDVAVPGD